MSMNDDFFDDIDTDFEDGFDNPDVASPRENPRTDNNHSLDDDSDLILPDDYVDEANVSNHPIDRLSVEDQDFLEDISNELGLENIETLLSKYGYEDNPQEFLSEFKKAQEKNEDEDYFNELVNVGNIDYRTAQQMVDQRRYQANEETRLVNEKVNQMNEFINHFEKETKTKFDFNNKKHDEMLREVHDQARAAGTSMKEHFSKSQRARDSIFEAAFDSYDY